MCMVFVRFHYIIAMAVAANAVVESIRLFVHIHIDTAQATVFVLSIQTKSYDEASDTRIYLLYSNSVVLVTFHTFVG